MPEQMIKSNGVELCTESFGAETDPPILLIAGLGASMLWWANELCQQLAAAQRFVIRYDHRDTGHSVNYKPGEPPYNSSDLFADAVGVLDAYGLKSAHLVGVSAGGAVAQIVALDSPKRVLSLTLISTTAAVSIDQKLPAPTTDFTQFVASAHVDWSDKPSAIDHLVSYSKLLAGNKRPFNEKQWRNLIEADLDRADSFASLQNHDVLEHLDESHPALSSATVPTLVVHGTEDPLFPLGHGQALATAIPHAELLVLEGAGHGVFEEDWPTLVPAILAITE